MIDGTPFAGNGVVDLNPFGCVDLGEGFCFSEWYGIYNPLFWPWVFHVEHGWQYIFPVGPGEVFIFDLETNDFWWTNSDLGPATFYSFNRGTFNFYFEGTGTGAADGSRSFVDLEADPAEFWNPPTP